MKMQTAIQAFYIYQKSGKYATNTIESYRQTLTRISEYLNNPDITNITLTDLREFMIHLTEKNITESTRQYYWKVIKSFFKWAEEELELPRPDKRLVMPKVQKPDILPYTEDEVKRILKACGKMKPAAPTNRSGYQAKRNTAKRDQIIIMILLDTGIRVSELCRLKYTDINLENKSLRIQTFETGIKTHDRTVFLGNTTMKLLFPYVSEKINDNDFLVKSRNDKPLNRNSVAHLLARIGKRANVSGVDAHRFRHTFAIQYLRNGGDIYTLQRLLGHRSLEIVKNYLKISELDTSNAHRKSSPVDNWNL